MSVFKSRFKAGIQGCFQGGLVAEGSESIVKQGKGIIRSYCLANTDVTEMDIQLAALDL